MEDLSVVRVSRLRHLQEAKVCVSVSTTTSRTVGLAGCVSVAIGGDCKRGGMRREGGAMRSRTMDDGVTEGKEAVDLNGLTQVDGNWLGVVTNRIGLDVNRGRRFAMPRLGGEQMARSPSGTRKKTRLRSRDFS
jgi:hypothetical protein